MPPSQTIPLRDWAGRLDALADPVIRDSPSHHPFSDELGHHRAVAGPLLAWRANRGDAPPATRPAAGADAPEVRLWRALSDRNADPLQILTATRGASGARTAADRGAVFPFPDHESIEAWTETELCAMHALWWLARERADPSLEAIATDAALWHLEHVQPDNATNHPWAVHVFLLLDHERAEPGARLHAECLIHNCQVTWGRPDRLSAWILRDAADALRAATE